MQNDRVRLAARPDTPAAALRVLAEDPAVTVRAAVALNACFAPEADRYLASDPDARVRAVLGAKLASLLPGLSSCEYAAAGAHVHDTLALLAGDAAAQVRATIAEAVKAMPEAPRAIILRLAADPVIAVSGPVLRLSPLLTDEDLLALLATPSHPDVPAAVAARRGLGDAVSEHIAAHADAAAVRILLSNGSAAIREATLDALVGRACDHPEWHEPLVRRPVLSLRALQGLSRMVVGCVLEALASRADVPPELASALRARMEDAASGPACGGAADAAGLDSDAELMESMERMAAQGLLTESGMVEALAAGEHRRAAMILAAASRTPLSAVDRAVGLRSAKALISLVWKAGFSMVAAQAVQSALGRLAPGDRFGPAQHGSFPLSGDEMEWQVELLANPGL